MNDKEPTRQQWKRRALLAEAELESIRRMRQFEHGREMDTHRKMAMLQVAMNEIKSAVEFALGVEA